MDDIIEWVLEAQRYFLQTGEVLQYHYVPRMTSYRKKALAYEREFLTMALAMWRSLPNTTTDIYLVLAKGSHVTLLLTYDFNANHPEMPPLVANLTVEQFTRPDKKILKQQQSMKTN